MRRTAFAFALISALIAAAPAAGATLPAGTYDVTLVGGSVQTGLLPPVPIPGQPPVTIVVPEGTPSEISIPLDALSSGTVTGQATAPPCPGIPFDCGSWPAEIPVTVDVFPAGPLTAGIDPSTGNANASGALYGSVTATLPIYGEVTCTFGSEQSPIALDLSTNAPGSPWDPVTGAFTLADPAVDMPAPSCNDAFIDLLFTTIVGDGSVEFDGTALRRPDPPPPPPPGPPAAPPPPPPPPPAASAPVSSVLRIASRSVRFNRRGRGAARLSCVSSPARCRGSLALTARRRVGGRMRTVRLGRVRFAIAPGRTVATRMRLTRSGRSLLSARRRVRAVATATVTGVRRPVTRRVSVTRARR